MRIIALLCLCAAPVAAQQQCGPRAAVVKVLTEKYKETRRGIGVSTNNMVMEVYAATESGTWTITVTRPDGVMCIIASGQGFEAVVEYLPKPGEPI